MDAELERMLDKDYPGELTARPLDAVRAMRADCQAVETDLSYLRRLAQGRLDIVGLEQQRRRDGVATADVASIVEALPDVLADRIHTAGAGGRLPQLLAPGDALPELEAELDAVVRDHDLSSLLTLSDEEIGGLSAALDAFERKVSRLRRQLFDRIDALQGEIARRYRTGEASVESLLH
ncbi:MAG: aerial mycelium formation protein [Acidimicrobiales bacterium]